MSNPTSLESQSAPTSDNSAASKETGNVPTADKLDVKTKERLPEANNESAGNSSKKSSSPACPTDVSPTSSTEGTPAIKTPSSESNESLLSQSAQLGLASAALQSFATSPLPPQAIFAGSLSPVPPISNFTFNPWITRMDRRLDFHNMTDENQPQVCPRKPRIMFPAELIAPDEYDDDERPLLRTDRSSYYERLNSTKNTSSRTEIQSRRQSLSRDGEREPCRVELWRALNGYYCDLRLMFEYQKMELYNRFPCRDMEYDWTRLYHWTEAWHLMDASKDGKWRRHLREAERTHVAESMARFSWKLQDGPKLLPPSQRWTSYGKFDYIFENKEGPSTDWNREPGSWWAARKHLFAEFRVTNFIDALEAETASIEKKSKFYKVQDKDYGMIARKRIFSEIQTGPDPPPPRRSRRAQQSQIINHELWQPQRIRLQEERSTESTGFYALNPLHLTPNATVTTPRRVKRTFKHTEFYPGNAWRARRRVQEKKAGRWTDGTFRQDRLWGQFHWVCDDEGVMISVRAVATEPKQLRMYAAPVEVTGDNGLGCGWFSGGWCSWWTACLCSG